MCVLQPCSFCLPARQAHLPSRAVLTPMQLELVAEVARCSSAASNYGAAPGVASETGSPASLSPFSAPAGSGPAAAAGGAADVADADLAAAENDSSVHNGTASPAASVKSFAGSDLGRVSVSSEVSWAS